MSGLSFLLPRFLFLPSWGAPRPSVDSCLDTASWIWERNVLFRWLSGFLLADVTSETRTHVEAARNVPDMMRVSGNPVVHWIQGFASGMGPLPPVVPHSTTGAFLSDPWWRKPHHRALGNWLCTSESLFLYLESRATHGIRWLDIFWGLNENSCGMLGMKEMLHGASVAILNINLSRRGTLFFFSGLFLLIVSGIEKILNIFYWINEWVDKTNHLAASLNSLMTFRLTGSRCFSEKSLLFGPQHGLPQTSFARGTSFLSSHRFWCCSLCIFFLNRKHVPLTGLLGLAPYHSIFLPPSQR